ncbi:MAG TPA: hypothetical protein VK807_23275 [Gemmatimonadaceae bacterium]|jgi:hypothetical protein|nr:hypothetical protein [Gemmatimonadaceae bacterium]
MTDFVRRTALKPCHLGHVREVLHVSEAARERVGYNTDPVLRIVFREYPEHNWWPSPTSTSACEQMLGLDHAQWIGARVPVAIYTAPWPKHHRRIAAPNPHDWLESLTEWDERRDELLPADARVDDRLDV